jgi:hypothetical protein
VHRVHHNGCSVVAIGKPKALLQSRPLARDDTVAQWTRLRPDCDVGVHLLASLIRTLVTEFRKELVALANLQHRREKDRVGEEAAEIDVLDVDDGIEEATAEGSVVYAEIELV